MGLYAVHVHVMLVHVLVTPVMPCVDVRWLVMRVHVMFRV